jgi:DNA-binding transcriptional LysR family regulator
VVEGTVRDLRHLWYFVQVARAGSFTAAAANLSLSAAALSKNIAGLERRMGVRLFLRTSRSLQLTSEGRAVLDRLGNTFEAIEETYRTAGQVSREPAGIVRLSTVTGYGKHCVLPLLPRFFERYPRVDLIMSFHDGRRGLTRQPFDVRINWGEPRERDKVALTLCRMPLIVVASPAYLARRGTPRAPQDLRQHDCINVTMANGSRVQWTFTPANGARRDRNPVTVTPVGRLLVMDELDAVADAAEAGLGLTVSSAENVLGALREKRLVRVLDDYVVSGERGLETEVIVQYARRKLLPAKVRVLLDFLVQELKGRDPLEVVSRVMGARR